jgi:putative ABC transport system permease protein
VFRIEANFLDVMGIDLVDGRDFNPAFSTDSTKAVLVNEALVRDFGWDKPVGQVLEGFYDDPEVIGVVRDLNFSSLKEEVAPMVFTMDPDWGVSHVLFQVRPDAVSAALELIGDTWEVITPGTPFSYSFLDEDLAAQYAAEQRWSRIISFSAGFAVLIACLGLFGLASIAVAGRTKEIGIRRALGGSVTSIAALLSREFVYIVLAAVVIAGPAAWLLAERWLNGFAYRIEIGLLVFVASAALALGIALLTVGFQTVRAARTDPVESLRTE